MKKILVTAIVSLCIFGCASTPYENFENRKLAGRKKLEAMSVQEKDKMEPILFERGQAFLKQKQASKAVGCFWAANELKPNNAKILYELGYSYQIVGLFTDSLASLTKSAELDPTEPRIYWFIGYVYHKQGEDDKALEYLNKSVSLNPKNYRSSMLMAEIYFKKKNYPQSKYYFDQFDSRLALVNQSVFSEDEKLYVNSAQEKESVFRGIMGKETATQPPIENK